MIRLPAALLILLLGLVGPGIPGEGWGIWGTAGLAAQSGVAQEIEEIIEATRWENARWSVLAVSLDTGDTLVARDPHLPLAPASNVKILTSAAALHHLGPDFRFRTFLLADGEVADGVLDGDLILYGTGDPSISDRLFATRTTVFRSLAQQLRERGIWRVTGEVVGDGSFLPGPEVHPTWDPEDLNDWYAAPASALSFNENVVSLRVRPGAPEAPPVIETLPPGADLPIANRAVTRNHSSRYGLAIVRETPRDSMSVEGMIRPNGRDVWRQLTVSDPPAYAASLLRSVLEEEGIRVDGGSRGHTQLARSVLPLASTWAPALDPSARAPRVVAVHDSPPLVDLLGVVNKVSHNLFAELIVKRLGHVVAGDGSFAGGSRVVEAFLEREVGVPPGEVDLTDGSGLSPENRASAAVFIRTLEYMAASPHWESFWNTLPEAGNRRELRRMYRTRAAGNLRAKTGTIEDVSALSGLVRSANGERILFSILANDVPSTTAAKRVEDRIGTRLADLRRSFQPLPDRTQVARTDDAPPVLRGQNPRHRVRSGENLSVIARRYGVNLDALISANPGVDRRPLQPGQVLEIPAGQ